jgi:hypothetical protein
VTRTKARLSFSQFLSSVCLWTILRKFPEILPVMVKRLIGRKFWGILGSFAGFGRVMILTSFQVAGKKQSRKR